LRRNNANLMIGGYDSLDLFHSGLSRVGESQV
jgi:hypothetical protein